MKDNNIVILLTATVKPGRMRMTKLIDEEIRTQQYIEALEYYLENTKLNIVFCENTNVNFYNKINSKYKKFRLEYLTFSGNYYNTKYGKSYGEKKIIEYALRNSKFISKAKFIIKITGRLKIINLKNIINNKINDNSVFCEFLFREFICGVCFLCPKKLLNEFISLDDSFFNEDLGNYLEIALYKYLLNKSNIRVLEFFPKIDGISGSFNVNYNELYEYNKNFTIRKLNHYAIASIFYKNRKFYIMYFISKIQWLMCLLRIKKKILYKKI